MRKMNIVVECARIFFCGMFGLFNEKMEKMKFGCLGGHSHFLGPFFAAFWFSEFVEYEVDFSLLLLPILWCFQLHSAPALGGHSIGYVVLYSRKICFNGFYFKFNGFNDALKLKMVNGMKIFGLVFLRYFKKYIN